MCASPPCRLYAYLHLSTGPVDAHLRPPQELLCAPSSSPTTNRLLTAAAATAVIVRGSTGCCLLLPLSMVCIVVRVISVSMLGIRSIPGHAAVNFIGIILRALLHMHTLGTDSTKYIYGLFFASSHNLVLS